MRRVFMIIIPLLIVLGIGLTGTRVLANADKNPIFPTIEKVQQMIAEALGQPPVLPPFEATLQYSVIRTSAGGPYSVQSVLDCNVNAGVYSGGQIDPTSWGVIHLSSRDRVAYGDGCVIEWFVPENDMPEYGTPINADLHLFYAGKSIDINTDITDWE